MSHASATAPTGRYYDGGSQAVRGEKPELGPARFIAEPAALGLAGFALSKMMLSFINACILGEIHRAPSSAVPYGPSPHRTRRNSGAG